MNYINMIKDAQTKGLTNETKMWQAISALAEGLTAMEKTNPDEYWKIMRKQHGIIYNKHYSEEFAKYDVEQLHYTDAQGTKQHGAHWTLAQVVSATQGMAFPKDVNDYDKYVAFNAAYSDLCRKFDDAQILDAGFLLYFDDEDWNERHGCTKIWEYFSM